MKNALRCVLVLAALLSAAPIAAESPSKCSTCPRDHHGRIVRSRKALHDFQVQTGYPHGRRGYVVDHIIPLACGGVDVPSNMQWQTIAAAKAKDKIERRGCSK